MKVARAIAVRGVSLGAAFLLSTSVARVLGPHHAGAFFIVFTVLALFSAAGRFGTDNLALRLLGGDSRTPRTDVRRLVQVACAVGIGSGVVAYFVIDGYVGSTVHPVTVILLATCVPAQALSVLAGSVLRGLGRLSSGVFAELGSLPMIATTMIVVAHLLTAGTATLDVALTSLAASAWITAGWAVPSALLAARRCAEEPEAGRASVARFLSSHGRKLLAMMGTSLFAYAMVWAPVFVLSLVGDLRDVSYYSVGMRVANLVALLPAVQISYLAPEFAMRFYGDDLKGLNALTRRSTLQVAVASLVPVLVLTLFARPVVTSVFGHEFAGSSPIVAILTASVFVVILFGQVNQLMLLCGLESYALALTSGALLVWATAGTWLGFHAGAVGLAWLGGSMPVAYAALAALVLRRSRGIRSYLRLA